MIASTFIRKTELLQRNSGLVWFGLGVFVATIYANATSSANRRRQENVTWELRVRGSGDNADATSGSGKKEGARKPEDAQAPADAAEEDAEDVQRHSSSEEDGFVIGSAADGDVAGSKQKSVSPFAMSLDLSLTTLPGSNYRATARVLDFSIEQSSAGE